MKPITLFYLLGLFPRGSAAFRLCKELTKALGFHPADVQPGPRLLLGVQPSAGSAPRRRRRQRDGKGLAAEFGFHRRGPTGDEPSRSASERGHRLAHTHPPAMVCLGVQMLKRQSFVHATIFTRGQHSALREGAVNKSQVKAHL